MLVLKAHGCATGGPRLEHLQPTMQPTSCQNPHHHRLRSQRAILFTPPVQATLPLPAAVASSLPQMLLLASSCLVTIASVSQHPWDLGIHSFIHLFIQEIITEFPL